jgi:hypothetical protein
MATFRFIIDQVLYRLSNGVPNVQGSVQEPDIKAALQQKINSKFRVRQFENMQTGETIPDGMCIATYEGIAVTSNGDRSRSILPAMPISLPRNMGVYDIRYQDNSFIPLQAGQRSLLKANSLLNNLLNQVGYETKGKYVDYTTDITLLGYDTVDMDLVVSDLSLLSETDVLPIPASYEEELVMELYTQFSPTPKDPFIVNPLSADKQQSR